MSGVPPRRALQALAPTSRWFPILCPTRKRINRCIIRPFRPIFVFLLLPFSVDASTLPAPQRARRYLQPANLSSTNHRNGLTIRKIEAQVNPAIAEGVLSAITTPDAQFRRRSTPYGARFQPAPQPTRWRVGFQATGMLFPRNGLLGRPAR